MRSTREEVIIVQLFLFFRITYRKLNIKGGALLNKCFSGLIVPLITPFKNGAVDFYSLEKITDYLLQGGADAFVALGTTAETPTLTEKEKKEILCFLLKHSCGKKVFAGAGSNCTAVATELSKEYERLGADGILSVTPYYNRPQEVGLFAHYLKISHSVNIPVLLYDVPKRCGTELSVELIKKLSKLKNITGIKLASDDICKFKNLKTELNNFDLYCGNDLLADEELVMGATGIISAAANAVPKLFSELIRLQRENKNASLKELFGEERETVKLLYCETNPAAIKYYMSLSGLCENELRLPMCPISRKNAAKINNLFSKKELV